MRKGQNALFQPFLYVLFSAKRVFNHQNAQTRPTTSSYKPPSCYSCLAAVAALSNSSVMSVAHNDNVRRCVFGGVLACTGITIAAVLVGCLERGNLQL